MQGGQHKGGSAKSGAVARHAIVLARDGADPDKGGKQA